MKQKLNNVRCRRVKKIAAREKTKKNKNEDIGEKVKREKTQ
jgi:hypothetical protein